MAVALPALSLVKRELLGTLRGWRPFLVLFLFVGGGTLIACLDWPRQTDDVYWASLLSRELMRSLLGLLFGACVLFVPAFAAGALVLERERGTYDFLRLSLIRPAGVVFAKLFNAVGFFLLVLVGTAPVMSVAFFLIGVDPLEMLQAGCVVVATAISCASAGLLSSSLTRRAAVAIGLSYVGVLALMLGAFIVAYFAGAVLYFFADVRAVFGLVAEIRFVTSPVFTLFGVFEGLAPRTFVLSLAYQAFFTGVCLAITHQRVRRPPNPPKIDQSRPIDDEAALRDRRLGWPYYIIDPLRRKPPIEDGRNPMLVRETRWGALNRGTTLIRVFYVAFVVYFFAGAVASLDARAYDTMGRWLLIQIVMTILTAPALTANALTKEYELRNLDMLRMTLLRPRDLIFGKLMAGVISVSPLLASSILSVVPVLLLGAGSWTMLAMGYGTLFLCTALSLTIAMLASLAARRTTVALVITYLGSVVVFVGMAMGAYFGIDAASSPGMYIEMKDLGWLSPLITFVEGGYVFDDRPREPDFAYWARGTAIWLAITAGLVAVAVYVFGRFKMRDR